MKKIMYIFMLILSLAPYMGVAVQASELVGKETLITADDYYEPQADFYNNNQNEDIEPIYDLKAKAELDNDSETIKYEAIITHKEGKYANLKESNIEIDGLDDEEINDFKLLYTMDKEEKEIDTKDIKVEDKYKIKTDTSKDIDEIKLAFTTPVTDEMGDTTPGVEFTFNYKEEKEYFVSDKADVIKLNQEEIVSKEEKESQNIEKAKTIIDPKVDPKVVGMDGGDLTNSEIQTYSQYSTYSETQYNKSGFSIGYESPDNDSGVTFDGTPIGDDKTGVDAKFLDDENGFESKVDHHGVLDFTVDPGGKITLLIPYKFDNASSTALGDDGTGKLSMWIDFDQDGTFSEDEYTEALITDENHYASDPIPNQGYSHAYYSKTIIEFTIPEDVKIGSTKLHTVLTTDQDSVTAADGNLTTYPGYGEIEDYQADFYELEDCTTTPYLNSNVMLAESVTQPNSNEILYTNIESSKGINFDIKIEITNNSNIELSLDEQTINGKYPINAKVKNTVPNNTDITLTLTETGTDKPVNIPLEAFISDLDDNKEWWILGDGYIPELVNQEDTAINLDGTNKTVATTVTSQATAIEGSYTSTNFQTNGSSSLHLIFGNSIGRTGSITYGVASEYADMACPETEIKKEIINETGNVDGQVENNEDITYGVEVTNEDDIDAVNVPVRDSMLENLPNYITYDGNVSVNPEVAYIGDLRDGTFVLDTVPANSSVEIEYTVSIGTIPEDIETVGNIVTDNGEDPEACLTADVEKDCDEVKIPIKPNTTIKKEIINETGNVDGQVENNEDITYGVEVTNEDDIDAVNVPVRDSMLENLPNYITYDGNVSVNPEVAYTGDLRDGTFVLDTVPANSSVEIEYTVSIGTIPEDIETVGNIVTDNGEDPEACLTADVEKDCDEVKIPIKPNTTIKKEIINETGNVDGQVENNEDITYGVEVTNEDDIDAVNVPVRDSMLENLPNYITYDGNVSVNPEVAYTGDLRDGTFVLDTVPANSSVEIEYTVSIGTIPEDIETVGNIVTDNGEDPEACLTADVEKDCDEVKIPIKPNTTIKKEIINETGNVDGQVENNEDITYGVEVTNEDDIDAVDVAIRDSMLENLPSYITYDGNVVVNPNNITYTGDLRDGTFVLDTVEANSSVEIEYTVSIGTIPEDIETVGNIVTDNGEDPEACLTADVEKDCDTVSTPTQIEDNKIESFVNTAKNHLIMIALLILTLLILTLLIFSIYTRRKIIKK